MKRYIGILLGVFALFGVNVVQSQKAVMTEEESGVVISEKNIASLATLLKKHKKNKEENSVRPLQITTGATSYEVTESSLEIAILRQEIEQMKRQLAFAEGDMTNKQGNLNTAASYGRDDAIRNLEIEMQDLRSRLSQSRNESKNAPIVVVQPENNTNQATNNLERLQRQLDSLYNSNRVEGQHQAQNNYSEEFIALQAKLSELQNEMIAKKATPTAFSLLKANYKDYSKKIYFANNSTALNTETTQIFEELFGILEANENVDVLIKGFASDKGSPLINEKISRERTEAVKKALILKGIHPTRILTQFHGIDYNAATETDARRAEISLLIRK